MAVTVACSVEGCERSIIARGWCNLHYRRWRIGGVPGDATLRRDPHRLCAVEGCDEAHFGRSYCKDHYSRWRYHGTPTPEAGRTRESLIRATHATCVVCNMAKEASSFRASRVTKNGLKARCVACDILVYHWRREYGLAYEDIYAAYTAQEGCCAICGECRPLGGRGSGLVVDHDHQTGQFRGLLCPQCNSFLGLAKDDRKRLARAIDYLAEG